MHELGLMTGVMSAVMKAAEDAGAQRVTDITLDIGDMTEVVDEALRFAFDALATGTICEGAQLHVNTIAPRSLCLECGTEYDHDRFHPACPQCGSHATHLLAGREMNIASIEVDIPD